MRARDSPTRVVMVGTTSMSVLTKGRTAKLTDQHERILARDNIRSPKADLPTTHHNQPKANSLINDNYCVDKLQERLLAGSQPPRKTLNTHLSETLVNFPVVKHVRTAPRLSQRKEVSPGVVDCYQECKLKYVEDVSCVTQLSFVKPVTNVQLAASNLPVGVRLQSCWQTWLNLDAGLKVVQILREGHTLPSRIRPNLTRSPNIISCYVNPQRNLYLLEALHQLMDKNAV